MLIRILAAGLVAAVLATGTAGAQGSQRPSMVISGDGARVLCASNQIVSVTSVTAYAVDIVCAPSRSLGPHNLTLVAPSVARVSCGKAGVPFGRGVLRTNRLTPYTVDMDCR